MPLSDILDHFLWLSTYILYKTLEQESHLASRSDPAGPTKGVVPLHILTYPAKKKD